MESELTREIGFFVPGIPITQGSMAPTGGGRMRHSNPELDAWREKVGWIGLHSRPYGWPSVLDGESPFGVELEFRLIRPAYLPKRILYPIKKRDLDKLMRAMLDALTTVLWRDDGQVTDAVLRKRFGTPSGVEVTVTQL